MAAKLKHKESLKRESSKESSESSKKVEIGRKRMKKNEKEGKIDGKALKGFRKSSKEVFWTLMTHGGKVTDEDVLTDEACAVRKHEKAG